MSSFPPPKFPIVPNFNQTNYLFEENVTIDYLLKQNYFKNGGIAKPSQIDLPFLRIKNQPIPPPPFVQKQGAIFSTIDSNGVETAEIIDIDQFGLKIGGAGVGGYRFKTLIHGIGFTNIPAVNTRYNITVNHFLNFANPNAATYIVTAQPGTNNPVVICGVINRLANSFDVQIYAITATAFPAQTNFSYIVLENP